MHVHSSTMESVRFSRTATLHMLEVQTQHADAVRLWGRHQGLDNLVLALTATTGAALALFGETAAGRTLLWLQAPPRSSQPWHYCSPTAVPPVSRFLAQAVPRLLTIAALTI